METVVLIKITDPITIRIIYGIGNAIIVFILVRQDIWRAGYPGRANLHVNNRIIIITNPFSTIRRIQQVNKPPHFTSEQAYVVAINYP